MKRTVYIGSVAAVVVAVAALMGTVAAYMAWGQTIFNTVAVTSNGQFVNAQLTDNVYVDMSSSPPKLKAKRPTLGIRPVEQADFSWQVPATVQLLAGYQLLVIVNGLEMTQDVDFKFDLASPRKIIPIDPKDSAKNVKWHFTDSAGNDIGPYAVKVHLFP